MQKHVLPDQEILLHIQWLRRRPPYNVLLHLTLGGNSTPSIVLGWGSLSAPLKEEKMSPEDFVRKRVAMLWKIAPYRIEVSIGPDDLKVEVDGCPPSEEQVKILSDDILAASAAARQAMN